MDNIRNLSTRALQAMISALNACEDELTQDDYSFKCELEYIVTDRLEDSSL
jgi:hypothetical protein